MDEQHLRWLELQAYQQVCRIWTRFLWRVHGVKPEKVGYSDDGSPEYRQARSALQIARKNNRYHFRYHSYVDRMGAKQKGIEPGYYRNRVDVVAKEIVSHARSIYSADRSRSRFNIEVGKGQIAGRRGVMRGNISLSLGYMWMRRVYPLYKIGIESTDWMILDAEQLKINAKHIKLYECKAYNSRLDENKTVFLAEKTTGKHEIVFGHTIRSVLDDIEGKVRDEVHEKMIGENHEQ